jgi:lichenysin synthetase B
MLSQPFSSQARPDVPAGPTGVLDRSPSGPVDLATDYPRDAGRPNMVGRVPLQLEPSLGRALATVGGRCGGDLGTLLLTAFGVLLYKYTGQDDLLIRVDLAHRGSGTLRLTIEPDAPFVSHLRQVFEATLATAEPELGAGVSFADRPIDGDPTAIADLAMSLGRGVKVSEARLDFNEALFDRATIVRMAGHLRQVLHSVVAEPERPVREVDVLTESERSCIVGAFNATARPYPRDTPVHRLFEAVTRRTPTALAIAYGKRHLTYGALNTRANRLSRRLRAAGVTAGQPVGLLLPRTPEMIVAILAILKSGGAYLPISPDDPPERIAYLLRDSGARVLVTMPHLAQSRRFDVQTVYAIDEGAAKDGAADVANADDPGSEGNSQSTDLAYIMYTSGTTGQPKGVQVRHRGIVRLVSNAGYVPLSAGTRILATAAAVFDVATFEIWGALLNGGSLHLVDDDVILSAPALGKALVGYAITTLWLTSPLFNQLVEQDATIFRSLRHLLVGGDVLSARHVGKVMDACPEITIVNGYGPTENTTFSTTHVLDREDLARIPIGRPIANSTAYVVNCDGQLCPVGVPGELCLGGDGVAAGYCNQPELTRRVFVPDPFAPDALMYRSGDIARWRPDGVIDFMGRRDQQVKVRGFRIELGEIENALLEHPAVRQAVVLPRPRADGSDKVLCAYYVANGATSSTGLRQLLKEKLPDYMVPSFFVELPDLPLNRNGKVDRARLPEPDRHVDARVEVVAPRSEVEETLVRLAEQALNVAGIGVQHDLRDFGADSLTATLLAARIEQAFGTRVVASQLLRDATLERIAQRLQQAVAPAAPAIERAPLQPTYPLTPQQRQLYVEQCKDEQATHYNVPVSLDLPPDTDVTRLTRALERLAARHDVLRTEFVFADGDVRQRIVPAVTIPLVVADGPAPTVGAFVRPFDLGQAPLWRAAIYRVPDARVHLRLDLHHIITDGVSLGVLFEELFALYDDPSGATLADVSRQFRDYAVWSASTAAAAWRREQGAYWRGVFDRPKPPADLPTDADRPPLRALDGGVVELDLGPDRTAALRRLARQEEITLFAVLAGAYSVLLAQLTGQPDVTIGTPMSGRALPGLDRTLGMLANTVCLRTEARPDLPFAAFLRLVGRTVDEAFVHQDYPFDDLVAAVAPRRDYRRNPLFDALIALHSSRYLAVDVHGERIPLRLEWNGQSVFDLNLQLYERGDTLQASWQYSSRLFRHATVEAWSRHFVEVLDAALADPHGVIGDLPNPVGVPMAPVPDAELDFDFAR